MDKKPQVLSFPDTYRYSRLRVSLVISWFSQTCFSDHLY